MVSGGGVVASLNFSSAVARVTDSMLLVSRLFELLSWSMQSAWAVVDVSASGFDADGEGEAFLSSSTSGFGQRTIRVFSPHRGSLTLGFSVLVFAAPGAWVGPFGLSGSECLLAVASPFWR